LEEIIKFNIGVNTDRVIAAALAVTVASKLDPVYGSIGDSDQRVESLYSKKTRHGGIFHQPRKTFQQSKPLFRR
jgi:hypothetical protein